MLIAKIPYQHLILSPHVKKNSIALSLLMTVLIISAPLYAVAQEPGSFSKLFEPSAIFTLVTVIVIIWICNYIKKRQQQRINHSLLNLAPVNGIKIIGLKPFRYVTETSATDGYDVTIENSTVTRIKERRAYAYSSAQAWEITLRNDSKESWTTLWLQYGEYDQHGRIREGEFKKAMISNFRPGETLTTSIQGKRKYSLVLENIRFNRLNPAIHHLHDVTFPVNLKMPEEKIIQIPVWIIAICIAVGFCMAASNVFLIVMAVVAVITAFSSLILSTMGSMLMPVLLYAALTEELTVIAILCGLYAGLDWFTKRSWRDYFGAHTSTYHSTPISAQ